jgi:hypothetical protein
MQLHQVIFLASGSQPTVRSGVSELVRVNLT